MLAIQRAGLLATPGVASSRLHLRGTKVNTFPNGGNIRSRSQHLGHRCNNKFTEIKAIASADKSASSSAGGSNVVIDNSAEKETLIILSGQNRPGKSFSHQSRSLQPSQVLFCSQPLFSFRFIGFSRLYLQ